MRLRNKSKADETAEELAARFFDAGNNCAQSVLLAMAEKRGIDIPDQMVLACTAFIGGIGQSGCVCGALAASSLVIGVVEGKGIGRKKRTQESANRFHELFKKQFGGTCCRVLRRGIAYGDPELSVRCCALTAKTAQLLDEYLFPAEAAARKEG